METDEKKYEVFKCFPSEIKKFPRATFPNVSLAGLDREQSEHPFPEPATDSSLDLCPDFDWSSIAQDFALL